MKKKALIVVNLAGFLHFLWNDISTLQEMGYEVSVAMNENSAAGPNLIEIPKLEEMGIAHYQVEFDTKSPVSTQTPVRSMDQRTALTGSSISRYRFFNAFSRASFSPKTPPNVLMTAASCASHG